MWPFYTLLLLLVSAPPLVTPPVDESCWIPAGFLWCNNAISLRQFVAVAIDVFASGFLGKLWLFSVHSTGSFDCVSDFFGSVLAQAVCYGRFVNLVVNAGDEWLRFLLSCRILCWNASQLGFSPALGCIEQVRTCFVLYVFSHSLCWN